MRKALINKAFPSRVYFILGSLWLVAAAVVAEDFEQPLLGLSQSANTQADTLDVFAIDQAYPWAVSLHTGDTEDGVDFDSQFCVGALIAKRWVLTAAYCVEDLRSEDLWVTVGAQFLDPTLKNERIKADAIVLHPKYDARSNSNNIALVRLATASSKRPIKVLSKASAHLIEVGSKVTVIGWGSQDDSINLGQLYEVDAYTFAREMCKTLYFGKIQFGMGCLSLPIADRTCGIYAGGPVAVRRGDQFYHFGVATWGMDCSKTPYYGVYLETGAYADWLQSARSGLAIIKNFKPRFVGAEYPYTFSYQVTNHSEQPKSIDYLNIMSFALIDKIHNQCQSKVLQPYEGCSIRLRVTPGAAAYFDSINDVKGLEETLSVAVGSYFPEVIQAEHSINTVSIDRLSVTEPSIYGMPLFTHSLTSWQEVVNQGVEASTPELHAGQPLDELPSMLLTYVEGPGTLHFDLNIAEGIDSVRLYDNGFLFSEMTEDFSFGQWHSAIYRISEGTHLIRLEVPRSNDSPLSVPLSLKGLKFVPEK